MSDEPPKPFSGGVGYLVGTMDCTVNFDCDYCGKSGGCWAPRQWETDELRLFLVMVRRLVFLAKRGTPRASASTER